MYLHYEVQVNENQEIKGSHTESLLLLLSSTSLRHFHSCESTFAKECPAVSASIPAFLLPPTKIIFLLKDCY